MDANQISGAILDRALFLHRRFGPGLLESVYEEVLSYELTKCGLSCARQVVVPLHHESLLLRTAFRADLVVEGCVIVEIKSVEMLLPVHGKQLLTYLKLSGFRLGLLINFNVALLKDGFVRIVNGL